MSLAALLADPNAVIELVVKGQYLDSDDALQTVWLSRSGWSDLPSGPAAQYCLPLIDLSVRVSQAVDPLEPATLIDTTFAQIELINDSVSYPGHFDDWYLYSVDGQDWLVYAVGMLSDGTRVELSDVESTPLYRLVGIAIPEVGSSTCVVRTVSIGQVFSTPLQPVTYSPPCLLFPGNTTDVVSLGNNLNITGVQSLSAWIYLTDPATTTQYILFKDSGTAGYYLAVGLVGAGTIAAGVEIVVRGQSPATSTTAANVLRAYQWHRIDISIDTTTRRIDIDGTTALTTTSITGTPTTTTTALTIGRSFVGRISRVLWWSNARSNAVMSAEGRIPVTGSETNLREAFLLAEGSGNQVESIKLGSSLTGTITDAVIWDTATWHYESIIGQHEPYVLGTVPRVPVTWIDPPKQIGQITHGAFALLSELQSNHSIVSPANYTIGFATGTFQVTSGALSGTYSATVTANNRWNSALLFGSTSSAVATITSPTGSRSIGVQFRADFTDAQFHSLIGWDASGAAVGRFMIRFNQSTLPSEPNRIQAFAINDAGGTFQVSPTAGLKQGRTYTVVASLNTSGSVVNGQAANSLYLYLDGELIGSIAISGAWTTALTQFGVGVRGFDSTRSWVGRLDEAFVFNRVVSVDEVKEFCANPLTGSESGLVYGWHLDNSAAPFAGATSLTLSNTTYIAGRSACTDLARTVAFIEGYVENDLDFDSWFEALTDCPYDCGWFVSNGALSISVLNILLGGLGFVLYESEGLLKLKRFKGVSGVADITLDPIIDLQAEPVDSTAADPPIYQRTVIYATNNSKQDAANIAGSLASTDPDRYQYGSVPHRSVPRSDGSILERFPSAEPRSRVTALLYRRDAEDEAGRLLELHKHGADRKSIPAFLSVGGLEILSEVGPLMSETALDDGNMIVTAIAAEEGVGTISIWRQTTD